MIHFRNVGVFKAVLTALVALLVLASCVPQEARTAVNEAICFAAQGGDPANLTLGEGVFTFDPGDTAALDAIAVGTGTDIDSPEAERTDQGNLRFFGNGQDIEEAVVMPFTGADRAISVTYLRPGSDIIRYCRVRE